MLIQRAYKTELDPSGEQVQAFLRHAGSVRYIYNWALARKQEVYKETGKSPSRFDLNRELTILKRTDCPWLYEVCNAALGNAIRQADAAYANFFRRLKEGKTGKNAGFPRFKSRKRGIGSFKLNGCIHVFERSIQLPVIGVVRLKEAEYLPQVGVRITSATVSERAGRWYVSMQVEEEIGEVSHEGPLVAVHLGVRRRATIGDGTTEEFLENPRTLSRHERRLARLQRAMARKEKGSANRRKAKMRVARLHQRIANIRSHTIHEATAAITKQYGIVVVQEWDVAAMLEEKKLSKRIADVAMFEFRRQLEYKTAWRGGQVVLIDKSYPVSKRCSACGAIKEDFPLGQQTFTCEACGFTADRDINAVHNLLALADAGKSPESLNACGGRVRLGLAEQPSMKQEPSHNGA